MEADTAAIRRFGAVATELAAAARTAATTVADVEIAQRSYNEIGVRFLDALRAAVAAHASEVVALGELLEQASAAAAETADRYVTADGAAAGLIGT